MTSSIVSKPYRSLYFDLSDYDLNDPNDNDSFGTASNPVAGSM